MKNKTKAFLAGAMCTGGIWWSYHENHTLDCETFVYQNKKYRMRFMAAAYCISLICIIPALDITRKNC